MKRKLLMTLMLAVVLAMGSQQIFGQIISQYVETSSGTTPKGIEIWNNTASTLDFAVNNLVIKKGVNGGAPAEDFTLDNGTLASGSVVVIGTDDMEATAVGNGAAFYLKAFTFNGDDALEVWYGATKTDVFGDPGSDPGSAWTGNGVQTNNQNIALLSGITTGDTDGWTDPSLRFSTVCTDNCLTGFGIAPAASSGPVITNIAHTPASPEPGQTVSVSADITDDGTVVSVELHWGTASGALGNIINMTLSSGSTYTTITDIPAQANGVTVYYVIHALDDDVDETTSPEQSYTVSGPATTTLPYSETFDTDLGDCYTYSVSGATKEWMWNSTYGFAQMNGFDSGDTEEDWLILPGINLDNYSNEILSFDTWYRFGSDDANNYLKLVYSTDYAGIGDPSGSTWTELTYTQPASDQTWGSSGSIDLSSISGTSVYIAFKYRYESGSYRLWEVDNIDIQEVTVDDPQAFAAAASSSSQIDLTFTLNMANDDVVIVYNATGTFSVPSGTTPVVGQPFAGGTLLYAGSTSPQAHTGLSSEETIYYMVYSYNGTNYSPGLTANATTFVAEPQDHVVGFTATANSSSAITVNWTDSDADTYLIKGSATGYGDIVAPIDGVAEADALLVKNVASGSGIWQFTGLSASTTYFFKIYPYNGTGTDIDYKTDGTVPQDEATTSTPVSVNAWINEFHYDNDGADVGEFVEVVIENAGSINLADFQVDLYNGSNGTSYDQKTLDDFTEGNTTDGFTFFSTEIVMQNGAPDGLALSFQGTLISGQFLSYEGSFAATDGPANGFTSTDIGVEELGSTLVGESLQLGGFGTTYDAFTWQSPLAETSGAINNNQFFVTPPSATTWTGVTSTDWFDASNWNLIVPGSTTDVTIPAGAPNYPDINAAAECNNLVMGSDATGDASLMGQSNLTVNGTTTVQRYFTDDNWHGLSAPVSGAITNDLYLGGSPEVWAKYYDEPTNAYLYETDLNAPLGDMKGWMVWVDASSPQTFNIHGSLRSGLVGPVALTNSGPGLGDGFNFVGNPFPSTIDWDATSGWFLTNVDAGFWIWNPDAAGGPNFASYNGIGVNGGTNLISSGQAFFVQVNAAETTGAISMNEDVQVPDAVNFMKSQTTISDYVKLKLSDGDRYDESVVRFHDQATEGYDSQLDMHKFFSWDEAQPQIYSTANDFMSINALPHGIPSAAMDVRGVDGNEFTIELAEVQDFAEVYLMDEVLGITTNLMESPYTFTYDATQTDRFTVFFSVVGTQENQLDNVQVYSFDKKVRVIIPTQMQAHVEIVNMLGQTVRELDAHMGTQEIDLDHSGYYVVSITGKNQTMTRKVFIK